MEEPMAFSKIVGLEVTPVRPSSSMSFLSWPVVMSERLMLSYQTETPKRSRSRSGFLLLMSLSSGTAKFALDGLDLVEAAHVALGVGEFGAHERAHDLEGQLRADDARAQAEHVHVVVL